MTQLSHGEEQKQQKTTSQKSRWQWAVLSAVFTVVFYFAGWTTLAVVAVLVTAVLSTVAVLSPRLRPADSYTSPGDGPQELTLHYPEPAEHGWYRCTVTPAQSTYVVEGVWQRFVTKWAI